MGYFNSQTKSPSRFVATFFAVSIFVAISTSSCRPAHNSRATAPLTQTPSAASPQQLQRADEDARAFVVRSQLGVVPEQTTDDLEVVRALIRWKKNGALAARGPYEAALTRDAKPEVTEHALLRIAVLDLNFACELVGLASPTEVLSDALDATAMSVIAEVRDTLAEAAAIKGPRVEQVNAVRESVSGSEVALEVCRASADAWRAPESTTFDAVVAAGCDDREGELCRAWGLWGGGGAAALKRGCDLDALHACVAAADRLVMLQGNAADTTDFGSAEAMYQRACKGGVEDGCRRDLALFAPARRPIYERACLTEANASGCIKLARVLALDAPDRPLWWHCAADERPPAPDPQTCAAGDALGCIARALALPVPEPHYVWLRGESAQDHAKAALACGEGNDDACTAGHLGFAASGDRLCSEVMLLTACERGRTQMCGIAP